MGLLLALGGTAPGWSVEPVVRSVDFEGTVNPVSIRRITRAIDDAEAAGDELVLIRLDTPGGLSASMEKVVKRMLASEVPIVVWVGPPGSRAGSAGFFILIAADLAAMAPGTRAGAASTVFGGGQGSEGDVLLKKANEDAAALIRSIAERRGRNPEACEKAVFSAKSFEESVALEQGLIDLVAPSRPALMELLDGRQIRRFDGTTVTLHTKNARFETSSFSTREEFMEVLARPEVAYLLLMMGMLGLYVEFTHPGLILPGVVGALCLLLFAFSVQVLPVSAVAMLLILLAVVMFILEIKVASYGMLTVGAVICLLLGSAMLIEGPIPELRVPWSVFIPTSIVIAGLFVLVVQLAVRAQRSRVGTGVEGLAGEQGTVTQALAPHGRVFVHGELWHAESNGPAIPEGTRVRILQVRDMLLIVEPVGESPPGRS